LPSGTTAGRALAPSGRLAQEVLVPGVLHQRQRPQLDGAGLLAQRDELHGDGEAAGAGPLPHLAEAAAAEELHQLVAGHGFDARFQP
jgi:hypothetical protein